MSLTDWLREKRVSSGLTQAQVAEAIGVTQGTVSSWETARQAVSVVTLSRLLDAYEVPEVERSEAFRMALADAARPTE